MQGCSCPITRWGLFQEKWHFSRVFDKLSYILTLKKRPMHRIKWGLFEKNQRDPKGLRLPGISQHCLFHITNIQKATTPKFHNFANSLIFPCMDFFCFAEPIYLNSASQRLYMLLFLSRDSNTVEPTSKSYLPGRVARHLQASCREDRALKTQ